MNHSVVVVWSACLQLGTRLGCGGGGSFSRLVAQILTGLRACTAELAQIIDGDLERPVPTCPEWTFRQLATHLGRGHR